MVLAEEREGGRSTTTMLYSYARGLESRETGVLAGGNLKRESEKGGGVGVVAEFPPQD